MGESLDDMIALRKHRQVEAAQRRDVAKIKLEEAGVRYTEFNQGAHLLVCYHGRLADFWPGTGRWRPRPSSAAMGDHREHGTGIVGLLTALRVGEDA